MLLQILKISVALLDSDSASNSDSSSTSDNTSDSDSVKINR